MKSAFLIWTALLLLVMFKAGSAFGQVQVTVLPSKTEYLERGLLAGLVEGHQRNDENLRSDPCPKAGESPGLSTGGNPPQH